MKSNIIYLAGPISSDLKEYKKKFDFWINHLTKKGHKVLHTTHLPIGLSYKTYIDISLETLKHANIVLFQSGWEKSKGCRLEREYAKRLGISIQYLPKMKYFNYEVDVEKR